MSFWWVNHNQTFNAEFHGGYIWSPQTNKNGAMNQSYINLTLAAKRDVVFSYAARKIQAVGKVITTAKVKQRPEAFGRTGQQWNKKGWLVRIAWTQLSDPLTPKDHISEIAPLLPDKYSPLLKNGNGSQREYLASISDKLGRRILSLINYDNFAFTNELDDNYDTKVEEEEEEKLLRSNTKKTVKDQLIKARLGQGQFKTSVAKIEKRCRVTGLSDKRLLVASHIKPWKDSDNFERLDGHNGFLLSPHIDKLFDNGYISFDDNGSILVSTKKILPALKIWRINRHRPAGRFTSRQKEYLEYHRNNIFKK